jgi:hypothetical protein
MTDRADDTKDASPDLARVGMVALVVGVAALAVCAVIGLFAGWQYFFRAYLNGFLPWLGLTIGCMGVLMLYHVVGGRWGEVIRPVLEIGSRNVVLMAVLFVPILFGLYYTYPWARPEHVKIDPVLRHQHRVWQYPSFFIIRAAIYFVIWTVMAFVLSGGLRRRETLADRIRAVDEGGGPSRWLSGFSAPGILVLCVSVTLATVDWSMSTEAGWFSTIYGLWSIAGNALFAFAFATVVMAVVHLWYAARTGTPPARAVDAGTPRRDGDGEVNGRGDGEPAPPAHADAHAPAGPVSERDWSDLANLTFTFTMVWAYLSLSQFLIIWMGNIPHETKFYHARSHGAWGAIAVLLIVAHFFIPFFLLLHREFKRDPRRLMGVALLLIAMRIVDHVWQIQPSYRGPDQPVPPLRAHHLLAPIAAIGVGGLWVAAFCWGVRGRGVANLLPPPAADAHGGHAGRPAHAPATPDGHGGAVVAYPAPGTGGHHA